MVEGGFILCPPDPLDTRHSHSYMSLIIARNNYFNVICDFYGNTHKNTIIIIIMTPDIFAHAHELDGCGSHALQLLSQRFCKHRVSTASYSTDMYIPQTVCAGRFSLAGMCR